jgi:hypothetical protein
VTSSDILPAFILIFWCLFSTFFRCSYEAWSGKRWGHGPNFALMWFPAIPLIVLVSSFLLIRSAPETLAWVVIALHILFFVIVFAFFASAKPR